MLTPATCTVWVSLCAVCRASALPCWGRLAPPPPYAGGGGLNLGDTIAPVHYAVKCRQRAVNVAAVAIEQGASTLLIPIMARRQLNERSDDMAVKISILSDVDVRAALIPARGE